jgi:hypothetical protein
MKKKNVTCLFSLGLTPFFFSLDELIEKKVKLHIERISRTTFFFGWFLWMNIQGKVQSGKSSKEDDGH